jgi:hypothetical protein
LTGTPSSQPNAGYIYVIRASIVHGFEWPRARAAAAHWLSEYSYGH